MQKYFVSIKDDNCPFIIMWLCEMRMTIQDQDIFINVLYLPAGIENENRKLIHYSV